MCLHKLEDFEVKSEFGWKCFDKDDRGLTGPWTGFVFPVNKWLDAGKRSGLLYTSHSGAPYKSGFHIYTSRDAARHSAWSGTIRKVKFKRVLATGREYSTKVIVAQEILVLPTKKRAK
jgi:hypothetical protein